MITQGEIVEKKPGKPLATLTKKAFAQIQEYIAGNLAHEGDIYILDVVTEAIRLSTGFDPDAKSPPELVAKQVARRKNKAQNDQTTIYDRYTKPRRESLKQKYPNVPTTILFNKTTSEIEKYANSLK